jgi:hypothetical protein
MAGQTSTELRHGGEHTSKKPGSGLEGVGAVRGEATEFARLGEERSEAERGSRTERENNTSLPGAEQVPNVGAEQVAAERR